MKHKLSVVLDFCKIEFNGSAIADALLKSNSTESESFAKGLLLILCAHKYQKPGYTGINFDII
jgi:hypothetical protein